MGAVDNTPLDFHSGKLGRYDKQSELEELESLREDRAGLDDYGPEGLEGQELLSWKIVVWLFDDMIRESEYEYGGNDYNCFSDRVALIDHVIQTKQLEVKNHISAALLDQSGNRLLTQRI